MGIDFEIPVNRNCRRCERPIYRFPRGKVWFLNTRLIEKNPGENVAKCDKADDGKHTP